MKKRNLFIIALTFAIFMPFSFLSAATLAERLSGKILLQVEDAGQAWYVEPGTGKRAFLGRPDDAFRIMRELGLGISEANYNIFASKVPAKFSGKILLRVEAHGEAYYVSPGDLQMNKQALQQEKQKMFLAPQTLFKLIKLLQPKIKLLQPL